jgi:hypothetical protein
MVEDRLMADKPKAPTPTFEELFRELLKIKGPMAPDYQVSLRFLPCCGSPPNRLCASC